MMRVVGMGVAAVTMVVVEVDDCSGGDSDDDDGLTRMVMAWQ